MVTRSKTLGGRDAAEVSQELSSGRSRRSYQCISIGRVKAKAEDEIVNMEPQQESPKGKEHQHNRAEAGGAGTVEGFDSFVDAAKRGARDAAKAAENTIPAVKKGIAKGAYVGCYYAAFAAVYSACLAMELVPKDSPVRHGFRDGADAARLAFAARSRHGAHAGQQPGQTEPLPVS